MIRTAALTLAVAALAMGTASASLLGDQIQGSFTFDGSAINQFDSNTATVVNVIPGLLNVGEFTGSGLNGPGGGDYDEVKASVVEIAGNTFVTVDFSLASGTTATLNGTIILQDLDWSPDPMQIDSIVENLGATGAAVNHTADSVVIQFTNLFIDESLSLEYQLNIVEEDTTPGGGGDPIPEPTTLTLLSLGAAAMALRQRRAKH